MTPAERIRALEAQYAATERKLREAESGLWEGLAEWAGIGDESSRAAARHNLGVLRRELDRWETVEIGWVDAGRTPTGRPYLRGDWELHGRNLGRELEVIAGVAADAAALAVVSATAGRTADVVAAPFVAVAQAAERLEENTQAAGGAGNIIVAAGAVLGVVVIAAGGWRLWRWANA